MDTLSNPDSSSAQVAPADRQSRSDSACDDCDSSKRHAACDECRKRKLKCSGETGGCTRCVKQKLICHYSQQKQMGRPRKKQKLSDSDELSDQGIFSVTADPLPSTTLRCTIDPVTLLDNESVCSKPFANFLKTYTPGPRAPFVTRGAIYEDQSTCINETSSSNSDTTPPFDSPPTPTLADPHPSFLSSWSGPDYSTMLELPRTVYDNQDSLASFESANTIPPTPACPCLPNLYLTLSTLSTLNSFPVSHHTLDTLQTAARTAHSVLYCNICPLSFQSGVQNVSLLGTLLLLLADGWNRVYKAPSRDIQRGFSPLTALGTQEDWDESKEAYWKLFAHSVVRQNVFGDAPPPSIVLPGRVGNPSLMSLTDAMERRQETWHGTMEPNSEFPFHVSATRPRCDTEASKHNMIDKDEMVCIKILDQVRMVVRCVGKSGEAAIRGKKD